MSQPDSTTGNGRNGGVKTLAIRLEPDVHAQLSLIAQLRDSTITDELKEAVTAHIANVKAAPELAARADSVIEDIEREPPPAGPPSPPYSAMNSPERHPPAAAVVAAAIRQEVTQADLTGQSRTTSVRTLAGQRLETTIWSLSRRSLPATPRKQLNREEVHAGRTTTKASCEASRSASQARAA